MKHNTTKTCTTCGENLPLTRKYFAPHKAYKDGFVTQCRDCKRKYDEEYRKKNKGRRKDYNRKYYLNHKSERKAHRLENKEHYREYLRQYYNEHKEIKNEQSRQWTIENKDYRRQYAQKRYWSNPDIHRERAREYGLRHKARKLASNRKRKAMKRNVEGTHNAADIDRIYCEQHGRCAYCGITLFDEYHVDHVIALVKGGANSPDNLVITCPDCNMRKGSKSLDEWKAIRGW